MYLRLRCRRVDEFAVFWEDDSVFRLLFTTSHFDLFLSMVMGMVPTLVFYSFGTSKVAKRIRFLLQCSLYRGSG